MNKYRSQKGLTVVEVLIALSLIGVIIAVFSTSLGGNLRVTQSTGQKGQAAQLMTYIGQQVINGNTAFLVNANSSQTFDYNSLGARTDLSTDAGLADLDNYKVTLSNVKQVTFQTISLFEYVINVCYKTQGDESCVQGSTLGHDLATLTPSP